MNNFDDYQKFFELRKKYPKNLDLISELMAAFFKNNDSFPDKFFINGTFDKNDVVVILNAFGISKVDCSSVYLRNIYRTYIILG